METTTSERVALMMAELEVDQPEFGRISGASKSVVNQWLSGLIKKISPKYAYAIETNTKYRKEWVMFGDGEKYKSPDEAPGNLNADDQRFIRMVTEAVLTREVPQHMRDTLLMMLGNCPAKAQDAPQQMAA